MNDCLSGLIVHGIYLKTPLDLIPLNDRDANVFSQRLSRFNKHAKLYLNIKYKRFQNICILVQLEKDCKMC